MEITVNEESRDVEPGTTVAELLRQLSMQPRQVAVERNLELVPREQSVALTGMLGGKYSVLVVDLASGRVERSSVLSSRGGVLTVPLVRARDEIAVRITYQGDPSPRFFTSPEALRLQERSGGAPR